jgi:outer membrane protein assembly factor BamB
MTAYVGSTVRTIAVFIAVGLSGTIALQAEDWAQYRGKDTRGIWNETGIVETLPAQMPVRWRTPIKNGYSGPAVADGRVFITDFEYTQRPIGTERAIALDEKTGKVLWTHSWEANYKGIGWDLGPGAIPTVDEDNVFVLGRAGHLFALDVKTGSVVWQKDYVKDYKVPRETWGLDFGFASPPLVDGERLICLVGGAPDAMVVAFDKKTGKEIWRALSSDVEPGYAPLIIINAGGARQLIAWDAGRVSSLDPATGRVHWVYPFRTRSMIITTPLFVDHKELGPLLMVSAVYNGSLMLALDRDKPGARLLWKGNSESEIVTDKLHALMNTPAVIGDYLYGICSYGQLRALKLATGERVWESQALVKVRVRYATAFWVQNGDRFFVASDNGDLVIAKFAPDGYHEISRTFLLKPTYQQGRRKVSWIHPAYANRHVIVRNDEEIVSFSLAADGQSQ